jgi:hypothetical protein
MPLCVDIPTLRYKTTELQYSVAGVQGGFLHRYAAFMLQLPDECVWIISTILEGS